MKTILTIGDSHEVTWLSSEPVQTQYDFWVERTQNDYEAMMHMLHHPGEVDMLVVNGNALEDDELDVFWLAQRTNAHILLLVSGLDGQLGAEHLADLPVTTLKQGDDLRLFAATIFSILYDERDASSSDHFVGV